MTFPGLQIIEIVLALLTLYIFLSILITAFNEFLDYILHMRSNLFTNAICYLIGTDLEGEFWDHPMIKSIASSKKAENKDLPKYPDIPNSIIADVFLISG